MRIKSSNKIKLDSILSAQNVKCKVTKGRQILSGHPNLTFATTLLVPGSHQNFGNLGTEYNLGSLWVSMSLKMQLSCGYVLLTGLITRVVERNSD